MPSLFRKKSGAGTAGDTDSKTKSARATTAAVPGRKANGAVDAIKNAFVGDESLLQLHAETAALLRLVKTPAAASVRSPSATAAMRQRSKGSTACGSPSAATLTKARVTIEVLDEDDDDDIDNEASAASSRNSSVDADRSRANRDGLRSHAGTGATASPSAFLLDPFAFAAEEARVRKAADTFYPHTSPSKHAMDQQVGAFTHEQTRLQQLAHNEALERARRHDELAYHTQHKLPSRLDASATTIQAHARGFLCRRSQQRHAQATAATKASEAALTTLTADQWHEVRDVDRNEVWYYNAATGQSQWDAPLGFVASTPASSSSLPLQQHVTSLPELRATTPKTSSDAVRSPVPLALHRLSATSSGIASHRSVELLPPLSPSMSVCSTARSDMSDRTVTPLTPTTAAPRRSIPSAASLPALQSPPLQASPQQHRTSHFAVGVTSVPNPWECDSVMEDNDASSSLWSQRTRDDDVDSSAYRTSTNRNSSSSSASMRRRSMLARYSNDNAPNDDDLEDDSAGDWQANDALFLADGSRNSKLRDTIRNALHVSKFDSISTLVASNVVLRTKKTRRRDSAPQDNGTTTVMQSSPTRSNQQQQRTKAREIVLGKRDAPLFVAMLSTDKSASPSRRRSRNAKDSPLRSTAKPSRSANAIGKSFAAPQIRDVVDPGFHNDDDDDPQQAADERRVNSDNDDTSDKPSNNNLYNAAAAAMCFNCWSSSSGRFCTVHVDPTANRKIKAAESALMCTNWDLDQLRRKYRAEELQEVFLKQSASLRYDKRLKQYVTIVECKHPIYRSIQELLTRWNKTMRRKLHVRAWFRSFMEQLRSGRVPRADTTTPGLLKLKNTIQNNRWCTSYSNSVRAFLPTAPVTLKNHTGDVIAPLVDVIMVHPARPQLRHWILVTEFATPIELYKSRTYELPPRRCVPMPTPSFLEEIPLPVPNVHIDCGDRVSWFERLCARVSAAALAKATLQIHACTPPRGITAPRRTKHVTPLTVLFATFARKSTTGNVAVGGLAAELLIHMLVTTYVPAQFGNFIVFDRRAIAPTLSKDHDTMYACLAIEAADPLYVARALEHALNVRRPPAVVIATRLSVGENASMRFPLNRPEQTGEQDANGFRTYWLVDAFDVPDDVTSVVVTPTSDVLSPNAPSMNTTVTTRVDRFYPFCVASTRANTPIEFIHLLWIGQSSRNQPQVFTTLGAQQPGQFMKHSDPSGALGVCTTVIYRSWAFAQQSPFEEFVTDDGVAYWYDKQTGETFWTRPLLPAESHRGKDGDVDGVVIDGRGEVATRGVGAVDGDDSVTYPQQAMRTYMTKSMEAPDEKDRRVQRVAASAKKHDIVIDLSGDEESQRPVASTSQRKALEKIHVPQLAFKRNKERSAGKTRQRTGASGVTHTLSPTKQQRSGSGSKEEHTNSNTSSGAGALDVNTKQLIDSITQALGTAMPSGAAGGGVDMLQLGIGLGMGLGLRAQQQQQQQTGGNSTATPSTGVSAASSRTSRSDRLRPPSSATRRGSTTLDQHDEDDEDNSDNSDTDDMSTARSCDSAYSDDTARSSASTATSVDMTLPPDEQELQLGSSSGPQRRMPPGHLAKTPGYQTHAPPGEGKSWAAKPIDASAESQTAVAGFGGTVHQRVACLPQDFVAAVTSTKTCQMQANYLPVIKNTNEPRSVGVVRPRHALDEWLPTQYSPWSAGRAVFGTQFITDLMARPELVSQMNAAASGGVGSSAAARAVGASTEQRREKVTHAMKESQQLEEIFSHCRHGKYDDVELSLNSPDWTLSIDARDAMGNTLLSIACQNNNKRIAKLCLRRGADINTQNLNGQSVLHYCHEYGFHDLMEYLLDKGAKDDVVNADGLTCYEGLNKEAVDAL